jgi:hypothetical protein
LTARAGLPDFQWFNKPKFTKWPKNIPKRRKIYKKWPQNGPNGHKIYQHLPLQDSPKFTQNWDFWYENIHTIWQP